MRRSWNVTKGSYNSTTLTVTVEVYYGNNQYKTVSWPITIYVMGSCTPPPGETAEIEWLASFTSTQSTTETTNVTGPSNPLTGKGKGVGGCI